MPQARAGDHGLLSQDSNQSRAGYYRGASRGRHRDPRRSIRARSRPRRLAPRVREFFSMANPNGNAALFFDLGGTLVKLNDTREIPLDANGDVVVELLPGVAEKLRPIHDHLMFVVTNQAGIRRGRLTAEKMEAALEHLDHQLGDRSEEHTSELQSLRHLVCRLL